MVYQIAFVSFLLNDMGYNSTNIRKERKKRSAELLTDQIDSTSKFSMIEQKSVHIYIHTYISTYVHVRTQYIPQIMFYKKEFIHSLRKLHLNKLLLNLFAKHFWYPLHITASNILQRRQKTPDILLYYLRGVTIQACY